MRKRRQNKGRCAQMGNQEAGLGGEVLRTSKTRCKKASLSDMSADATIFVVVRKLLHALSPMMIWGWGCQEKMGQGWGVGRTEGG